LLASGVTAAQRARWKSDQAASRSRSKIPTGTPSSYSSPHAEPNS
jgi:hypothetical protein